MFGCWENVSATVPSKLQALIDAIEEYGLSIGLELNVSKTKVMVFCNRRTKEIRELANSFHIRGKQIDCVWEFVFLGTPITFNLSWQAAITAATNRGRTAHRRTESGRSRADSVTGGFDGARSVGGRTTPPAHQVGRALPRRAPRSIL